jgi:toxin CcdB
MAMTSALRSEVSTGRGLLRPTNVSLDRALLEAAPEPARRLNAVFQINGRDYAMFTQFAAAVARRDCGPVAASLAGDHSTNTNALDMLITGY